MTKANTLGSLPGSFASVAFSGSYSDLSGKPTNLSQFTDNVGFLTGITSTQVTTALGFTPETTVNRNAVNGYAGLDSSGLVPSSLLPSYVDDVLEYANLAAFPGTGTSGKIFVALDSGKTYRWSGSAYVEISASPGSTDAVTEGATNLYFSNARARAAISATGSLSYNSTTGVLSYTAPTNVSAFTNDSGYITSSALSPYLLSTTASSTYQTQAGMSSYLTSSSASSTYLPLSGGTLTGNLALSGTSLRITGDFTNATRASRLMFQTSTVDSNTFLSLIPNGTGTGSGLDVHQNAADPDNSAFGRFAVTATSVNVRSGVSGTGTQLPLTFLIGSSEYGRLTTVGNWLIGTTTDDGVNKLQVTGGAYVSGNFGIGVSSPSQKLAVSSSGANIARFIGNSANNYIAVSDDNDSNRATFGSIGGGNAYVYSGGYVALYSGSSERARIAATGNLLIGTTSDSGTGRLQVAGNVAITGIMKQTALQETKTTISASDIDLSTANYFSKTISGATTFTVSNTPSSGTAASFILDLTNGGAGTITWWAGVKWAGGTAPTLTATGRDTLGFFTYDGGTTWTGLVIGKDVK